MSKALEQASQGKNTTAIDTNRFRLEAPSTSSLESWTSAIDNAQAQLEHQQNRMINLELVNKFGSNSWKIHNYQLEHAKNLIKTQADEIRAKITFLNKSRKLDQVPLK